MKRNTGNQYCSRKQTLWGWIHLAHDFLIQGEVQAARDALFKYRLAYHFTPASTRRRWKCGR